jgi:DNA-binding CsgD family transcriptional regulator
MEIEDDGRGFEADRIQASAREHVGLASMRERAEAVGGWCRIESMPGRGTSVRCWLPHPSPVSRDERADPRIASTADAPLSSRSERSSLPGLPADLSPREVEVAELLALGHTNVEVAAILHLSVRTIEHHRSRVFRKLGVHSRAGLVRALRERT